MGRRDKQSAKSTKGAANKRAGERRRSNRQRGSLPYSVTAGDGVVVNGYSEEWLSKGFNWVYREEVLGQTGALVSGQVVDIRSRAGKTLGTGVWDQAGKIAVRRFRAQPGPIDQALLGHRLSTARSARPISDNTTAWRWVHGENDDLPGVRVDVWGRHISIALDSDSLKGLLEPLIDEIVKQHETDAIWLSTRGVDAETGQKMSEGQIWGEPNDGVIRVLERGIGAQVYLGEGHDKGLYCDMRGLRAWLEPYWNGRRVLNTFAHTGMFSVAAAFHGASEVVSVDLSPRYLDRARTNFDINGLDPNAYEFLAEDTFKVLDRYRRKGDRFDIVIADPPSFSHGPKGDWAGKSGLSRLVQACAAVTQTGGWMVVASNQGAMTPKDFHRAIQLGGRKAKCQLRIIHQGSPPIDFPAALDFPESRYLKIWVVHVGRSS